MTATLIEIGALARTRPAVDASPVVVADWYEQKAVVLRHIACETPSECDTYIALADRAHTHAQELLVLAQRGVAIR